MKKLFVSLFSILFLLSTADDCLARPGHGGERGGQPPRHSQGAMNRSSRSVSRSVAATQSVDSGTNSGTSRQSARSDNRPFRQNESASSDFDSNREDSGFSQNQSRRGMNPPPPAPLDEDGNPMPPPDNDESGFGRRGMNPPPPPPLDEDGNPMPPPDEGESDFEDGE